MLWTALGNTVENIHLKVEIPLSYGNIPYCSTSLFVVYGGGGVLGLNLPWNFVQLVKT